MEQARWCHLMLRVLGVLFVGLSIPAAFRQTLQVVSTFQGTGQSVLQYGFGDLLQIAAWAVGAYFQLLFGLYLLFKGHAVARWCLRGLDSCCPACGYDLEEVAANKCPECGAERVAS